MISIIGTRPQYIKVAAIDRYCKANGIDHKIIDTRQHYSYEMSGQMIKDLELKIDISFGMEQTEMYFIFKTIQRLSEYLKGDEKVLLYGDTNTTFCAALVCYKLGIPFGHVEAGARTGGRHPEEINRIFTDGVSTVNFCTTHKHSENVKNAVVSGSLEYEILNDNRINPRITKNGYGIITIHRQSNMNKDRFRVIMWFAKAMKKKIFLVIHHRLENQDWFNRKEMPKNVEIIKPLTHTSMACFMATCDFILTDSGSIVKTAPFFGKKTLILRQENGWDEVVNEGYAKLFTGTSEDVDFLSEDIERNKRFYMQDKPASEIICTTMTTLT